MVPPVLTCSRKLVSKAVRSLSAEFDKETVPTSVSGDSDTRQLAFFGADNSVLSPPDSSIAAFSHQQQFEVLSTTVLEVSQDIYSDYLCTFLFLIFISCCIYRMRLQCLVGKGAYFKHIPTA
jgi:hypothetical protein